MKGEWTQGLFNCDTESALIYHGPSIFIYTGFWSLANPCLPLVMSATDMSWSWARGCNARPFISQIGYAVTVQLHPSPKTPGRCIPKRSLSQHALAKSNPKHHNFFL